MAFPVPDPYRQAIRSSVQITYTVDALLGGAPVAGATGLQPIGGSVTDSTKQVLRRTLSLDLAGDQTLYALLAPTGTRLLVTAHVQYTSQTSVAIPMGVFVIDQLSYSEGDGKLSVTAPDRGVLVQRAKFAQPQTSTPGVKITDTIVGLLQGALGASEQVTVLSSTTAAVGTMTWQQDRVQAVADLAESAGLWVYPDRGGGFVIQDTPTISSSADWLVDASPSGVLISLDRQKSRTRTYNVVAVDSSSVSGEAFPTQFVWDSDSNSPTYAGPVGSGTAPPDPNSAGPFGLSTYLHADSAITDAATAQATARSILYRTTGISSQINASQVPNPAVDAWDALDVLPPPQQGVGRFLERHIVDQVTHGLDVTAAQQIQGRSTRSDSYS